MTEYETYNDMIVEGWNDKQRLQTTQDELLAVYINEKGKSSKGIWTPTVICKM